MLLPDRLHRSQGSSCPSTARTSIGSVGMMREGACMLRGHRSLCHQDMEAAASQPLTARGQVKEETGYSVCTAPTFRKRPWSNNR